MIYRRCACRNQAGQAYGNLPADHPTTAQVERACPRLVSDRKHGKWGYYLSRGFDASGKRLQTRVANFDGERAARSAYAKAKTLHDSGLYVETSRTRFADWLTEWLDGRIARGELKPSTIDNYRRYVTQDIAPSALGRMRLTDIRRTDVRRFVDGLVTAGRGTYTVQRILAVVQSSLTAAMRDDAIAANPAHGVPSPRPAAYEFEPWEPAQVGTFLDVAATDRLGALSRSQSSPACAGPNCSGSDGATSTLRADRSPCDQRACKRSQVSSRVRRRRRPGAGSFNSTTPRWVRSWRGGSRRKASARPGVMLGNRRATCTPMRTALRCGRSTSPVGSRHCDARLDCPR